MMKYDLGGSNMRQGLIKLTLICSLMLTSCGVSSPPIGLTPEMATSTHAPTPTSVPPTPTPDASFHLEALSVLNKEGDTAVIGLIENRTLQAATQITVCIELKNAADKTVAVKSVPLLIQYLPPYQSGPFSATFWGVNQVDHVELEICAFSPTTIELTALNTEILAVTRQSRAEYVVVGRIHNLGTNPAEIRSLQLVIRDSSKKLQEISTGLIFPTFLAGGHTLPFLLITEHPPEIADSHIYLDAIGATPPPSPQISFSLSPSLHYDSQGNPFVRGALRNDNPADYWVSGIIYLQSQGELVSLSKLIPPIPLSSGEVLPFSISQLPALSERMQALSLHPEDLQVRTYIDPLASTPSNRQKVSMQIRVTGLELSSGALNLRGALHNPSDMQVESASVVATLFSKDGVVLNAGWHSLKSALDPGESTSFSLPIGLPRGLSLADIEFDLRGVGLIEKPGSPH